MRVRVKATSLRHLSYLISASTGTARNWNLTPVPVNIFAIPGKDISELLPSGAYSASPIITREKDTVAVARRVIVDWVSPRRSCR